jgi:hypothetical protein
MVDCAVVAMRENKARQPSSHRARLIVSEALVAVVERLLASGCKPGKAMPVSSVLLDGHHAELSEFMRHSKTNPSLAYKLS